MSEEKFQLSEGVSKFLDARQEFESSTDFQNWFSQNFIRRDAINEDSELRNSIVAKRMGELTTHLRRHAKNSGLEIAKEGNIEDVLDKFTEGIQAKYQNEISELQSKNSQTDDELFKALQDENKKLKDSLSQKDTLLKENTELHNKKMQEFEMKEKDRRINEVRRNAYDKISFSKDLPDLAIDGFKSRINNEVFASFDENNDIIAVDKDGNRFRDKGVADKFLNFEEVLQQKAIEYNVIAKNPKADKFADTTPSFSESKLEEAEPKRKAAKPIGM